MRKLCLLCLLTFFIAGFSNAIAGSITATIEPDAAVDIDAMWRLQLTDGTWSQWFDSGEIFYWDTPGYMTIRCSNRTPFGWINPPNRIFYFDGINYTTVCTYTLEPDDMTDFCLIPIAPGISINQKWERENEGGYSHEACESQHRFGHHAKYFVFSLSSSQTVNLNLTSYDNKDTYMYLLNGEGKYGSILDEDDDGGDGIGHFRNSRIVITLPAGTYTIEATTYYKNQVGDFNMSME